MESLGDPGKWLEGTSRLGRAQGAVGEFPIPLLLQLSSGLSRMRRTRFVELELTSLPSSFLSHTVRSHPSSTIIFDDGTEFNKINVSPPCLDGPVDRVEKAPSVSPLRLEPLKLTSLAFFRFFRRLLGSRHLSFERSTSVAPPPCPRHLSTRTFLTPFRSTRNLNNHDLLFFDLRLSTESRNYMRLNLSEPGGLAGLGAVVFGGDGTKKGSG